MEKISLIFGVSFNTSFSDSDASLKSFIQKALIPIIEFCSSRPGAKAVLGLDGAAFERFEKIEPSVFDALKTLVQRRSVELLGGPMFAPIFSLIPERDLTGQTEAFSEYFLSVFGTKPSGARVTKGAWETRFAAALARNGIEYVFIDDKLFLAAGIPQKDLAGFFITESEGETLNVFPNSAGLADILKCGGLGEFIGSLKSMAGRSEPISVLMDLSSPVDLKPVLACLKENFDLIRMTLPSDCLGSGSPQGRVYLSSDLQTITRPLVRYPLLNDLHKKMLYASAKVDSAKRIAVFGGDGERDKVIKEAEVELWRGQAGAAYTREGIAEKSVKDEAFRRLILSENLIEKLNRGGAKFADFSHTDIDKDGETEAILGNETLNLYFSKVRGLLFELDYKPKAVCLIGVHDENGTRRGALIDHILPLEQNADDPKSDGFRIDDLFSLTARRSLNEASITLSAGAQKDGRGIRIAKTISVVSGQSIVNISYELDNPEDSAIGVRVLSEFNLSFPSRLNAGRIMRAGEKLELAGPREISSRSLKFIDEQLEYSVSFDMFDEVVFYCLPLFGRGERPERTDLLGVRVIPSWEAELPPKGKKIFGISLKVEG